MKIKDLEPQPVISHDHDNTLEFVPSLDGAEGIMMTCPNEGCSHKIMVWFKNPLNAQVASSKWQPAPRWERVGEDIDTLTIRPSIQLGSGCRWHGFITNGEAIKC